MVAQHGETCVTWLIRMCDMPQSYVWHDLLTILELWRCGAYNLRQFVVAHFGRTWLIHTCDVTRSYVWHDSFMCVLWLVDYLRIKTMRHDSFIYVTWLVHICSMTHSDVWSDSFMCDMTHPYMWRDSLSMWHDAFIYVTWRMNMCNMTHSSFKWPVHACDMTHPYMRLHSYIWRDSFICATWRFLHVRSVTPVNKFAHIKASRHIYMTYWQVSRTGNNWSNICDMTHSYVWRDSFICRTWLIHMCNMTDWQVSWTGNNWRNVCDMTHWYVRHESLICATWLIYMCDMTDWQVSWTGNNRSHMIRVPDAPRFEVTATPTATHTTRMTHCNTYYKTHTQPEPYDSRTRCAAFWGNCNTDCNTDYNEHY